MKHVSGITVGESRTEHLSQVLHYTSPDSWIT